MTEPTAVGPRLAARPASVPPRPRALLWWGVGVLAGFAAMTASVLADPKYPWAQGWDDLWRGGSAPRPTAPSSTARSPCSSSTSASRSARWRRSSSSRYSSRRSAAGGLYGPLFTVDHGSFPSGHTVSMGIMVVAILALIPPTRRAWRAVWCVVGVLLSVGMVAQRTLINAHWFFDAVSGLVAGIGVALVLWYAFWPWLNRDYRRRGRPRPNEINQGARRDRHLRGHRRLTDHGGEGFADQRR